MRFRLGEDAGETAEDLEECRHRGVVKGHGDALSWHGFFTAEWRVPQMGWPGEQYTSARAETGVKVIPAARWLRRRAARGHHASVRAIRPSARSPRASRT